MPWPWQVDSVAAERVDGAAAELALGGLDTGVDHIGANRRAGVLELCTDYSSRIAGSMRSRFQRWAELLVPREFGLGARRGVQLDGLVRLDRYDVRVGAEQSDFLRGQRGGEAVDGVAIDMIWRDICRYFGAFFQRDDVVSGRRLNGWLRRRWPAPGGRRPPARGPAACLICPMLDTFLPRWPFEDMGHDLLSAISPAAHIAIRLLGYAE